MVSDSTFNASIQNVPKDFSKKKRANRSAKLKQCKLDARRDQFLSQVVKKDVKEVGSVNGCVSGEFNGLTVERRKLKGKEVTSVCLDVDDDHESVYEELSLANSPTISVNHLGNKYDRSSGSSSSSCCSASSLCFRNGRNCSEEEEEDEDEEDGGEVVFHGDDGCLDDWETVADALVGCKTNDHGEEASQGDERVMEVECKRVNNKAWRPDDAFRPQSLPNLSKHWSSPANSEKLSSHGFNPWVRNMMSPAPTSCPICCEDLDLTDSSFLPCPCGFRLCLFCHKRILEEDSRCPGCRKPYTSEVVEKETSISGGSLTIRLARSCSMFPRV